MSITVKTKLMWNDANDTYIAAMDTDQLKVYSKTADRIRDIAVSLVRTDTHALQRTIRARVSKKQHAAFVFAGDRNNNIFYSHMVEYGTYFKPAHPFMRPAVAINFNPLKEEARHAAQRTINAQRRLDNHTLAKQQLRARLAKRNERGQFTERGPGGIGRRDREALSGF